MKFYIARIAIFDLFCSCDLDLVSMTFIYEFDPYLLEMYVMCENELSAFESYRLTDIHRDTTAIRRFAGGQ